MSTGELTREGLAKAKNRGVKLGSSRPGRWKGREHRRGWKKGAQASIQSRKKKSRDYYATLVPIMLAARNAGYSFQEVADALEAGDWVTITGKPFATGTIYTIIRRHISNGWL
jgi:DNA invertase Pin-like site-specific DNA recombinase